MDRTATQMMIQRIASKQLQGLDAFARIAVMEGIAGIQPWTWAKAGLRGLALAQKALPNLDEEWFSPGDTGVVNAMFAAAKGTGVDRETALDLVQSILSGATLTTKGGEPYAVGKYLAKENDFALSRARSLLSLHARQRAQAEGRGPKNVSLTEDPEGGGGGSSMLDIPTVPPSFDDALAENLLSGNSRLWKEGRKIIVRHMGEPLHGVREVTGPSRAGINPSYLEVYDLFMLNPNAGSTAVMKEWNALRNERQNKQWQAEALAAKRRGDPVPEKPKERKTTNPSMVSRILHDLMGVISKHRDELPEDIHREILRSDIMSGRVARRNSK